MNIGLGITQTDVLSVLFSDIRVSSVFNPWLNLHSPLPTLTEVLSYGFMRLMKTRLDQALLSRGLVDSREKAQRLIMAGQVRLNDQIASKASQKAGEEDNIEVIAQERFASRGGEKLVAALEQFKISCQDKICLDLGASTGGFTDCLLQHGAKKVYCVDVGKNQLAWKLRSDPRVHVLDETNARYLKPTMLSEPAELVTADVSFIALSKVIPAAVACAIPTAEFVVLIKPQFEAGREHVERGGVVRDPEVHKQVVENFKNFVENTLNAQWQDVMKSPLLGPAGNQEFLAWFKLCTNR